MNQPMKHSTTTHLVRFFVIGIAILMFGVATFGMGLGVGASTQQHALTSALPGAELARAVCVPAVAADSTDLSAAGNAPQAEARPTVQSPAPAEAPANRATGDEPLFAQASSDTPLDLDLFNEAWRLLEQQFYGALPEGDDITYAAIRGVLASLDDKHTSFADPEQAKMFNLDMQGVFEGVGALVDLAEGGGVELQYLFEDQPAIKAGLHVGDVVIAVDGEDVTGLDLSEAISKIRGPRGTQVTLTIQREEAEPFDVTVTRARIEVPTVETETVGDDTGDGAIEHITLFEFSANAPRRLADALTAAVAKNPAGIILDLRGNPGGLLDSSVQIGSYFVPEGNILIERFRDGKEEVYERQGRYLLGDIPLVVLVDGGSASASEIVAGAIQDAGTGTLIGEKTYGKGSVQLSNELSDDSQLKITIARWFTPKDRAIHGTGLEPDIVVPMTDEDREAERDPQLDRAIEFLLQGK